MIQYYNIIYIVILLYDTVISLYNCKAKEEIIDVFEINWSRVYYISVFHCLVVKILEVIPLIGWNLMRLLISNGISFGLRVTHAITYKWKDLSPYIVNLSYVYDWNRKNISI